MKRFSALRKDAMYERLKRVCGMLVTGTTIREIATEFNRTNSTAVLYIQRIEEAGVLIKRTLECRAYRLRLGQSYESAVEAVEFYLSDRNERLSASSREANNRVSDRSGKGVESWLFLTGERAQAYKNWCEPWTAG